MWYSEIGVLWCESQHQARHPVEGRLSNPDHKSVLFTQGTLSYYVLLLPKKLSKTDRAWNDPILVKSFQVSGSSLCFKIGLRENLGDSEMVET